jgi:prevent-host-death family protein
MARHIQAARARKEFAELLDRSARGERIKIRRYRSTVAVIVPKGDLEKLEKCEEDSVSGAPRRRR